MKHLKLFEVFDEFTNDVFGFKTKLSIWVWTKTFNANSDAVIEKFCIELDKKGIKNVNKGWLGDDDDDIDEGITPAHNYGKLRYRVDLDGPHDMNDIVEMFPIQNTTWGKNLSSRLDIKVLQDGELSREEYKIGYAPLQGFVRLRVL